MTILIRLLQIILHLPLLFTIVPGNVISTFRVLISIAMFDVLENDYGIGPELFFEFDEESQQKISVDIMDQAKELGYESRNIIKSLGSLAICILVYFMAIMSLFLFYIAQFILKRYYIKNWVWRWFKFQKKILIFAVLLPIVLHGYLDFMIGGVYNLKNTVMTTDGEIISLLLGHAILGLTLWLSVITIWLMCLD